MACVVPAIGTCPAAIVCIPMTKVCARAPTASVAVPARPTVTSRVAK
jgi:hypothetical protein